VAEQPFASQATKGFGLLINFKTLIFVENPWRQLGFLWPFPSLQTNSGTVYLGA